MTLVVSITAPRTPAQLSLRFHAAATTAPATPTPAASVGVAQPM